MKFPSWSDFRDGVTNFERYIRDEKTKTIERIEDLKDDHPVFDEIIKRAIPFLPTPFNGIAQAIYSSFEGPKKDKVDEVLKFLEEIKSQTEEHYKEVTYQLDNILSEISDIKAIVAKEDTLQLIKEILISKDNTANQKLDILKNELDNIKELHQKLENDLYQSYGLSWLSTDYFEYHKSTDKDIENWKKGFSFELEAIKEGKDFRRNIVIDDIKGKIESQHQLLIVGESGTSKSTILKEIMCDYFDDGYNILYNYGNTYINNGDQLVNFIEGLLRDSNKVFVAVDNAHDERTSPIFYVMDKISRYGLTRNVRFLLTARLPEFDWFLKERLSKVQEEVRSSIRKLTDDSNFRYELPFFTRNEIKEFIEWYSKNIDDESAISSEESEKIYRETNGHPIILKFYIIGKGLEEDVKERYDRYLTDPMSMQTMLVCSLLDIANLQITDELLEGMELIENAYGLNHATLYQYSDGSWKTMHPRWDLELLSFLYNESDKAIVFKRKEHLKKAIQSIFTIKDQITTHLVVITLYNIAADRKIPIDIVESQVQIPDYVENKMQAYLYGVIIAFAYSKLNRPDKVLEKCEIAQQAYSEYAEVWHNKGTALGQLGRYDEAIVCFEKALEIDPNYAKAWNNMGLSLYYSAKYDEAINFFEKAIELDRYYAYEWHNKSNVLDQLGRYEEARKCFEKAKELDRYYAYAWLNKGTSLAKLGRHEEAIVCFDKTIEIDPKNVDAWYNKGTALGQLGRYDEAIVCFDKVIDQDPKFKAAWEKKRMILRTLGRHDELMKTFDQAVENDPHRALAYNDTGLALYNLAKYDEAIEFFDKAIKIDSKYVDAWGNKGAALNRLGKYEDAIKCFDKVLEIDPNNAYSTYYRGNALGNLGKYEDAIKCFDKVLEIDPNNAYAWGNKGLCLDKAGRTLEALKYYDKSLEIDPNDVYALNNKGLALRKLGRYVDAKICLDKIEQLKSIGDYSSKNT